MAQFHKAVSAIAPDQHDDKGERQRPQMQNLSQNHEYDQSDEGGQHEHVAVREIDHADDAEDHRVADGDKSVDRPQREPVDQLLQEIIHATTCPPVSPPLRRKRAIRVAALSFSRSRFHRRLRARREHSPEFLRR